jgi:hypothetical protein
MAVVGEAHVLVKAVTTGFDGELRRQLRGIAGGVGPDGRAAGESLGQAFNRGFNRGSGNIFEKVTEGLRTMYPEAEQTRLVFRSLVRTTYTVGTALTVLVGGISALIGGIVALVAAVGRAAPALAGMASALVQIRLAAIFANFSLKGIGQAVSAATEQSRGFGESIAEVNERFQQLQFTAEAAALSETQAALNLEKALETLRSSADLPPNSRARREAELAYEQAELAYRQAKDRTQDLNEEVAKGPQALAGGSDPYAGLTESQKVFAKFLAELSPKLEELREDVASGFLPALQTQIQDLVDLYFPDLEDAFTRIGTALGVGSGNLFDNFLDEDTKAEVNTFLDNLEKNIPLIGEIFGELGEVLLRVFNDADGIGTQFLEFVRDTLADWNTQLEQFGLESVFGDAFATGTRLFGIIGNIINGLGDFFTVLNDSGAIDTILDFFELSTAGFANLIDDQGNVSEEGRIVGQTFNDLATNFGPVAQFIGAIIDSFLKLGANENIGEFFKILLDEDNAANWDSIFKAFADAGPALAELIVALGELFAAFADEGAPTIFFETITELIKPIAAFFGSEAVKPFIDDISRLFALLSAAFFVFDQIRNLFLVVVGNIIAFFSTALTIFGAFKVTFGVIGKVLGFLQTQFLRLVLGPSKVLAVLGRIGLFLTGPIGIAIGIVTTLLGIFFTQTETGKKVWESLTSFISDSLKNVGDFFTTLWTNITDGFDAMIEGFSNVNLGDVFRSIVNGAISVFEGFINNIITGFNNGLLRAINSIRVEIPGWVRAAAEFAGYSLPANVGFNLPPIALARIPRLAEGGIVPASAGGTIAQIAEAGRPERVEPLDERGLSKRDYAMLDAMKARGGGINITVNPSAGMNERELAEMVSRKIALEIRKGTF